MSFLRIIRSDFVVVSVFFGLIFNSSAGILPPEDFRAPTFFVALATGHLGQDYEDSIANSFGQPASNFRVSVGQLPAGVTLDVNTGKLSGRPTSKGSTEIRFTATASTGQLLELKAALSILSGSESEIIPGQYFGNSGPHSVSTTYVSFQWTSSFDDATRTSRGMVFTPFVPGTAKMPVLVFHRGRGFSFSDYFNFLSKVASWGIVCASVEDLESFATQSTAGALSRYDVVRPELGMLNASSAQEAMMDYLLERNANISDVLHNRLNVEAVFISGHSRGGGASHASHQRSLSLKARGIIYFMAYDLRYFSEVIPPGVAPAYGIPGQLSALPSLVVSASDDGDLVFPYSDQFIDRATGPMTFVTVHRAIHNYLGDSKTPDAVTQLTEAEQQATIAHFVVAFIRRWANYDVSLDGNLYGKEWANSPKVSVASFRKSSPLLKVDDFQDAQPGQNLLGGTNSVVGMTRAEASVYPNPYFGSFASLGLAHSQLNITQNPARFDMSLGAVPRDVSGMGALLFRFKNTLDAFAFDGWVVLKDASGREASVKLANENGTSTGYLKPPPQSGESFNRFVTVNIALNDFYKANPSLDFSNVDRVSLVFNNAVGTRVAVDDVRFEGGPMLQNMVVVSAADGKPLLSSDSIASVYGSRLATATKVTTLPLPFEQLGTKVFVRDSAGVERPSPLFYVSDQQVNFLVPSGTASGTANIRVESGIGNVFNSLAEVRAVAPGLFTANGTGKGVAAAQFYRVKPNTTPAYEDVAMLMSSTRTWVEKPVDLDVAGGSEVYLVLFGTGIRGTTQAVTATVGGIRAPVLYAGPQGNYVGLDQINLRLPTTLQGRGKVDVVLTVDNVVSNTVTIAVQ